MKYVSLMRASTLVCIVLCAQFVGVDSGRGGGGGRGAGGGSRGSSGLFTRIRAPIWAKAHAEHQVHAEHLAHAAVAVG